MNSLVGRLAYGCFIITIILVIIFSIFWINSTDKQTVNDKKEVTTSIDNPFCRSKVETLIGGTLLTISNIIAYIVYKNSASKGIKNGWMNTISKKFDYYTDYGITPYINPYVYTLNEENEYVKRIFDQNEINYDSDNGLPRGFTRYNDISSFNMDIYLKRWPLTDQEKKQGALHRFVRLGTDFCIVQPKDENKYLLLHRDNVRMFLKYDNHKVISKIDSLIKNRKNQLAKYNSYLLSYYDNDDIKTMCSDYTKLYGDDISLKDSISNNLKTYINESINNSIKICDDLINLYKQKLIKNIDVDKIASYIEARQLPVFEVIHKDIIDGEILTLEHTKDEYIKKLQEVTDPIVKYCHINSNVDSRVATTSIDTHMLDTYKNEDVVLNNIKGPVMERVKIDGPKYTTDYSSLTNVLKKKRSDVVVGPNSIHIQDEHMQYGPVMDSTTINMLDSKKLNKESDIHKKEKELENKKDKKRLQKAMMGKIHPEITDDIEKRKQELINDYQEVKRIDNERREQAENEINLAKDKQIKSQITDLLNNIDMSKNQQTVKKELERIKSNKSLNKIADEYTKSDITEQIKLKESEIKANYELNDLNQSVMKAIETINDSINSKTKIKYNSLMDIIDKNKKIIDDGLIAYNSLINKYKSIADVTFKNIIKNAQMRLDEINLADNTVNLNIAKKYIEFFDIATTKDDLEPSVRYELLNQIMDKYKDLYSENSSMFSMNGLKTPLYMKNIVSDVSKNIETQKQVLDKTKEYEVNANDIIVSLKTAIDNKNIDINKLNKELERFDSLNKNDSFLVPDGIKIKFKEEINKLKPTILAINKYSDYDQLKKLAESLIKEIKRDFVECNKKNGSSNINCCNSIKPKVDLFYDTIDKLSNSSINKPDNYKSDIDDLNYSFTELCSKSLERCNEVCKSTKDEGPKVNTLEDAIFEEKHKNIIKAIDFIVINKDSTNESIQAQVANKIREIHNDIYTLKKSSYIVDKYGNSLNSTELYLYSIEQYINSKNQTQSIPVKKPINLPYPPPKITKITGVDNKKNIFAPILHTPINQNIKDISDNLNKISSNIKSSIEPVQNNQEDDEWAWDDTDNSDIVIEKNTTYNKKVSPSEDEEPIEYERPGTAHSGEKSYYAVRDYNNQVNRIIDELDNKNISNRRAEELQKEHKLLVQRDRNILSNDTIEKNNTIIKKLVSAIKQNNNDYY